MVGNRFESCFVFAFGSIPGSILGSILKRFDNDNGNLLLTWNGKRVFIVLRFFPFLFYSSFLASPRICGRAGGTTFYVSSHLFFLFSRLFSLLPASAGPAGGPAGRLLTFLPVSSPFVASTQPKNIYTHTHTNNNNHSNNSELSTTPMHDVKSALI